MSDQWVVVGWRRAWDRSPCCNCSEEEEHVALFSSKAAAQEYVNASRLKRHPGYGHSPFRSSSLLSSYDGAYVEFYEAPDLPLDPEL